VVHEDAWVVGTEVEREALPRLDVDERLVRLVGLLEQQGFGFSPEAKGCEIHMRSCPFHELAETHPDVVCAVHKGLISGGLSALGSDLDVEALDVFVEPDLCVARLARPSARAGSDPRGRR
jgi:predicted ArsR family transcriptional regulator